VGQTNWVRVDRPAIDEGRVTTVVAAGRSLCLVHHEGGDLASFAELCGARGFRASTAAEVGPALEAAFAVTDGPSLVSLATTNREV
jgi:thiamine pyrophosphate-dependent acetolactate synthase large subunit-like protein